MRNRCMKCDEEWPCVASESDDRVEAANHHEVTLRCWRCDCPVLLDQAPNTRDAALAKYAPPADDACPCHEAWRMINRVPVAS